MFQRALLSDEGVAALADAAVEILERVGVLCQNEEMMAALEAWGALVDRASEQVRFPRRLVEEFAAGLRRETAGAPEQAEVFRAPRRPAVETQVAQFYYDDDTGERRGGTRADLARLARLGDGLHPEVPVGHALLLREPPPLLEPLEAGLVLAENARRPAGPFAWDVRQVDYLIEMGEILGIPDWYSMSAVCFAHPLRLDRDVAARFVRMAKREQPTGLTGMQVAGASTPVTVAGYVAVSAAEFVAVWIAGRALNERMPIGGSIWGGTLDMGTGDVSYSAPDAMLRAFAVVEFLRRWCGHTIAIGGGEYTSAKAPGLYAALEKAHKAMTMAAFTGVHPPIGQGMVDNGRTISAVQLLLDHEMTVAIESLAQDIEVTPESIGLETILQVGFGLESSYLTTDHTLRHFRSSLWQPRIIDRTGYRGCATDEAVMARARARVDELLTRHRPPDRDPAVFERLRAVIERARRGLL